MCEKHATIKERYDHCHEKCSLSKKNNHCLWPVCGVGFSVFPWEGVIGKLRGVPDKYFFIQPFLYCTWKNWFWSLLSKSSLGLFWCVYNIWYMIYIKFHHCDHPGIRSSPLIWVHVTALVSGGSYWPGPHLGQAWPLISETNHLDGHGWGEGCVIKQSNFLLYFSSTSPSKTLLMTTKIIQRWQWQKPAATLMMIKTQWWS